MLECQFKFFREGPATFQVMWSTTDEHGVTIDSGSRKYTPLNGEPIDTMNEAKVKIRATLRMDVKYRFPGRDCKFVCTNPEKDFLSRSEMYALSRKKIQAAQGVLDLPETSVVPDSDTDQLYEVVEVLTPNGTVWTIKKHTEPYYTEAEAKTELFKRIVNG